MTLQWTVIAFILYAEIGALLILLLPWIRPTMWKRVFNSRIVHKLKNFSNVYAYAFIFVLLLLFVDATREVRKYSHIDIARDAPARADADAVIHMRLFRAQRNLYISGFSLLLALVIRRIVQLLSRCSQLELSAEAALKQAEGAGKAAQTLMDKSDGKESAEEKQLRDEVKQLRAQVQKANTDRDTMREQAENLQEEYERVTAQLREAEQVAQQQPVVEMAQAPTPPTDNAGSGPMNPDSYKWTQSNRVKRRYGPTSSVPIFSVDDHRQPPPDAAAARAEEARRTNNEDCRAKTDPGK